MLNKFKAKALLLVCGFALTSSASHADDAPTGGDPRTRAFVLSGIVWESPGEGGKCEQMSEGGAQIFAKTLPASVQAQYATPDKAQALWRLEAERLGYRHVIVGETNNVEKRAKLPEGFDLSAPMTPARALEIAAYNGFPEGKGRATWSGKSIQYDSCTNPEDFQVLNKGLHPYTGTVAAGMNLDGKVSRSDYTGPDGTRGVDNQLWRAMGCVPTFMDEADPKNAKETLLSAQAPTAIVVRNLDDIANDPDVTVDIYGVREPIVRDARGKVIRGHTFTPVADRSLHASFKGRIEDGILTTEPGDLNVQVKEQIVDIHRSFRGARIRMTFKPDGTVEGGIYGYYSLASLWDYFVQRTQLSADFTRYSCPALHHAFNRLADGYRDPATGRYTAISSAFGFVGTHSFVAAPDKASGASEAS